MILEDALENRARRIAQAGRLDGALGLCMGRAGGNRERATINVI